MLRANMMNKGRDVITGIDKSKDISMPQRAQRNNQYWKGGEFLKKILHLWLS